MTKKEIQLRGGGTVELTVLDSSSPKLTDPPEGRLCKLPSEMTRVNIARVRDRHQARRGSTVASEGWGRFENTSGAARGPERPCCCHHACAKGSAPPRRRRNLRAQ